MFLWEVQYTGMLLALESEHKALVVSTQGLKADLYDRDSTIVSALLGLCCCLPHPSPSQAATHQAIFSSPPPPTHTSAHKVPRHAFLR